MSRKIGKLKPVHLLLMGLGLLGIGACVFAQTLVILRGVAESEHWPTVPGKIVSSELVHRGSGQNATYEAELAYEYEVGGRKYSAGRLRFGGHATNRPSAAERIVNLYPSGRTVTVHYDPDDPAVAVLEAATGRRTYVALVIGAFLMVAGATCMLSGLYMRTRRRRSAP